MKYWRGYLTAAIFAAITMAIRKLGENYSQLVDMVYPYVTRSVQSFLAVWTGAVDFNVWQLVGIGMVVVALAALVLTVIFKRSVIQWLGWVLAVCSIVSCVNTAIYGLNFYAGPIEADLRLEMQPYSQEELAEAAAYYRDKANELAPTFSRDAEGNVTFSDFETLASQTGSAYRYLVRERYFSIFGGEYVPVKQLGGADWYTARGISGYTCYLTGEAAVNPQIPAQALPFNMAREMAHRMCVARDNEADFAAFLACTASENPEYQYSGYFMAYRYCLSALRSGSPGLADTLAAGCAAEFAQDLEAYDRFYEDHQDKEITELGNKVSDAYLSVTGGDTGIPSYGRVSDYLVNWYRSLNVVVEEEETVPQFDPYDKSQVDLSGLVNAQ